MIKTLLVLSGAVLLAAPAVHAQDRREAIGARRGISAYHGYGYGYGGRHHYGRYYYFGGVPYFYPFYGYGFGYPGYAYGWYGDGIAGPYGYGDPGYGGAYEGRVADNDRNGPPSDSGPSLPEAVQRQLSKKGYYKGSIDGQFGPASRGALSRFQHDHGLKETGRIDEPTLDALGFTDRR